MVTELTLKTRGATVKARYSYASCVTGNRKSLYDREYYHKSGRNAIICSYANARGKELYGVKVNGPPNPRGTYGECRSFNQRWYGGKFIGAFSYDYATKLALDFVVYDKLSKGII
jgi:hypothetical protein